MHPVPKVKLLLSMLFSITTPKYGSIHWRRFWEITSRWIDGGIVAEFHRWSISPRHQSIEWNDVQSSETRIIRTGLLGQWKQRWWLDQSSVAIDQWEWLWARRGEISRQATLAHRIDGSSEQESFSTQHICQCSTQAGKLEQRSASWSSSNSR